MAHMAYCTSHDCLPKIGPVQKKMVSTVFLDTGSFAFTMLCGACLYRMEHGENVKVRVYT
jgi:hypothetical protein